MNESEMVQKTLAEPHLHAEWDETYHTQENDRFYDIVFDYLVENLQPPSDTTFLDVGCGPGRHALRLARRGFAVMAVDFSEAALRLAASNVRAEGLEARIKLQRENLLCLSSPKGAFDYILCWGVLMHVPDLEKAISELARVLKAGGILIIGENNMHSVEAILLGFLRRLSPRGPWSTVRTAAGIEYWKSVPGGKMLVRQSDVKRLVKRFREHGLVLREHLAGQFTEAYTKIGSPWLGSCVHLLNRFWFSYVGVPHVAVGNIIIFEKRR